MKIAIIDLGTNTFHLLIVQVNPDQSFTTIVKKKIAVKLGKNGISKGKISGNATIRAIKALGEFQQLIFTHSVDNVRAFATSAIRNASNKTEFLRNIKKQIPIDIEIINGDTEAFFIYHGVKSSIPIVDTSLIIDIGGGSVEFIICDQNEIFWKESFEIGAQRLFDQYHSEDPISPLALRFMGNYLDKELGNLKSKIAEFKPKIIIGASGTFDSLLDIYKLTHKSNASNSHVLPVPAVQIIFDRLKTLNKDGRLQIDGMESLRADMIVVATALIIFVINSFQFEHIHVSEGALKEGCISLINKGEL